MFLHVNFFGNYTRETEFTGVKTIDKLHALKGREIYKHIDAKIDLLP